MNLKEGGSAHAQQVIAIAKQKGGVGKTVGTVNLGVGLTRAGKCILLVDVDPQIRLTVSLCIHPTS